MDAQMHEALRQILGKLDGLEDSLAKQGQGLRAVQQDVQAVKGDVKAVKASQKELKAAQKELQQEVQPEVPVLPRKVDQPVPRLRCKPRSPPVRGCWAGPALDCCCAL